MSKLKLKVPFDMKDAVIIEAVKDGSPISYKALNQIIHDKIDEGIKNIYLKNVSGQRFIGAAIQGDIKIYIDGIAGNDLGIFMDGPEIYVDGNSEDQSGNTMNDGKIIINGSTGDVTGLSARGGEIYVKKGVGFRVGIHVKEYKGRMMKLIVGSTCKDYFGEYMAGGILVILGLDIKDDKVTDIDDVLVGNAIGTGIHGGVIYVRTNEIPEHLLGLGAKFMEFTDSDKKKIQPYISNFCNYFNVDESIVWKKGFYKIKAASKRPYSSNYCKDIV